MKKRALLLSPLAVLAAGAGFFRVVPMEPDIWHVDPEAGARTGRPNEYLVGSGGARDAILTDVLPAALALRVWQVALAEDGVELIAGGHEGGWMTFVHRSRLFGFPDAISVKVVPEGSGSRLTIWSRSRYGHSDMGVNRRRVERWLAAAGLG